MSNEEELHDQLFDLRDYLRVRIKGGYVKKSQIPNLLDEGMECVDYDGDEGLAREILKDLIMELSKQQEHNQGKTDNDRLDEAFHELEGSGIIAKENFSCCMTCGTQEIMELIAQEVESGKQIEGYTFFHMQNTDSAVEGAGLYLAYGSVDGLDESAREIGQRVAQAMTEVGLDVNWSGDVEQRIHINMNWNKKLELPAPDEI